MDAVMIENFEHAYLCSKNANLDGFDVIVAIGGDGTINRVLNGFYDESGRRISNALFGVVHTGGSPDFCLSYDVPLEPESAVFALSRRRIRSIPVGMIRHGMQSDGARPEGAAAATRTDYFVCCANVGLGASLARKANSGIRNRFGDTAGTFISLMKTLREFEAEDHKVTIDDVTQNIDKVYNIAVGLTPRIASGLKVSPRLFDFGRRFYILILRDLNARRLFPVIHKVYSGRPFRNTAVLSIMEGENVVFKRVSKKSEIECDGDPCGELPCRISMARDNLDLIH